VAILLLLCADVSWLFLFLFFRSSLLIGGERWNVVLTPTHFRSSSKAFENEARGDEATSEKPKQKQHQHNSLAKH
jgi:hypothetical protein